MYCLQYLNKSTRQLRRGWILACWLSSRRTAVGGGSGEVGPWQPARAFQNRLAGEFQVKSLKCSDRDHKQNNCNFFGNAANSFPFRFCSSSSHHDAESKPSFDTCDHCALSESAHDLNKTNIEPAALCSLFSSLIERKTRIARTWRPTILRLANDHHIQVDNLNLKELEGKRDEHSLRVGRFQVFFVVIDE